MEFFMTLLTECLLISLWGVQFCGVAGALLLLIEILSKKMLPEFLWETLDQMADLFTFGLFKCISI